MPTLILSSKYRFVILTIVPNLEDPIERFPASSKGNLLLPSLICFFSLIVPRFILPSSSSKIVVRSDIPWNYDSNKERYQTMEHIFSTSVSKGPSVLLIRSFVLMLSCFFYICSIRARGFGVLDDPFIRCCRFLF